MDDLYYHMTEFKCLKAVFIKWQHVLLTIYHVIIQKTMSPRKSQEDFMIKFFKS